MRSGSTVCSAPYSVSRPWTQSVERADALDPRAHLDEAIGEIGDFWLARGALDQGLAAGEHRRHQRIMGGADRDLGELDLVAGEPAVAPRAMT